MHVVTRSQKDPEGWQVVLLRNSATEYKIALQDADRRLHGVDFCRNAEEAIAAYITRCTFNGVEA